MMRTLRLSPSIRRKYFDDHSCKFASKGGAGNSNRNDVLRDLLSGSSANRKSNSSRFAEKWSNDTGENAAKASQVAKKHKPRISFFDEVDYFLSKEKDKSLDASTILPFGNRAESGTSIAEWSSHLGNDGKKMKSIFDVFKVPDPVPERSEFAFDIDACHEFVAMLDEVCSRQESEDENFLSADLKAKVLEWLRADEPICRPVLPLFKEICEQGIETIDKEKREQHAFKKQVMDEIEQQAAIFQESLGWNEQQYTYATSMIDRIAELSSTDHKALPVVIIFEKMKEAGYVDKLTLTHCLRAASSFSGGVLSKGRGIFGSHFSNKNRLYDILEGKQSRNEQPVGAEDHVDDTATVPEQLASANDFLYEPIYNSTAIRIKRLISMDNPDGALELIESSLANETKLRSYSQVFSLYLELGNVTSAIDLFEKMKENHNTLNVEPEMFVQLMAALAERGFFCHGAKMIGPDAPASGPRLFDHLAQEMSEYVYSITSASAKRLQRALKRGFEKQASSESDVTSSLAPLRPLRGEKILPQFLIADRVSVEASTGFCVCSNTTLRLIGLEQYQKEEMKNSLIEMAKASRRDIKRENHQEKSLLSFWDWMNNRKGPPFTVIVDGPNVAYYMQNFDKGKFNFHQIEFVVTALEKIGERPLVILPRKYGNSSFYATVGEKKQQVTENETSIIQRLWTSEKLYFVPQACLDDYFWLLASVSEQSSCQAGDLEGSLPKTRMQWPGNRPVVMTNDHIRDHQEFQFLPPRLFNRWYSSTIMNYNFTGFVGDECVDPEIAFTPADLYSREIQGNTATTNGTSSSCLSWHFPVQDWDTTDWFCVRLPAT